MVKQERVWGTGSEVVYGSDRRSESAFWGPFEHLDAPFFIPAGSRVKLERDGEESIVAINVLMRGRVWK